MQPRVRHNKTRHTLRLITLAALLGVSTIALSQCRMVSDNVTGVKTGAGTLSGRSNCSRQCNDSFEAAIRAEEARHRAALRSCGHDSRCRSDEDSLNDRNEAMISSARKECKRGCYNEGGGHGR